MTRSNVSNIGHCDARVDTSISRLTPISELPELVRADEAAAWLDCSTGCVYTMAASGQLASVRLGRLLRIPRAALAAMLQR